MQKPDLSFIRACALMFLMDAAETLFAILMLVCMAPFLVPMILMAPFEHRVINNYIHHSTRVGRDPKSSRWWPPTIDTP